ncbi:MAG: hypothetical protein OEV74_11075 [Cyclobacteriaceae bacterium]|nr:hypothetical protein [Cyclobacteriaceae bacterium]MDH4296814.1 hypothetical protein [Cyclobacteriaceae bacterium]MDH5247444.1 hypothetical protein [Cyclobacteriaceae bacterium]
MSVVARLISGSAASWAQIGVGLVTQIALVPVYLVYWDVRTYGIWLAIQALVSVISMLDFGHQTFLGYEFLRLGTGNRAELSRYLCSGIVVGVIIGVAQIILLAAFHITGSLSLILGESSDPDPDLLYSAGIVLVLQSIAWLIVSGISGLLTRVLTPFGYFPRVAWWGFAYAIVIALAPLLAVVLGADLLVTGIAAACASVAYSIPLYYDLFALLRKEKIAFSRPSWKLGYSNFLHSLALFGKSLFENIRQQGARLVLAPISGAAGLAAFSTMRTGANVALQGLNTITNPLMPDLIRFLHQRDQIKSEAAFGTIWIVVMGLMCPGVVILQAFVEPFYTLWTRGKIPFDPLLFAVLSLGVLVYAVIQPAIAVVIGNNMLKPQLGLSGLAAIIVIVGIFALVPSFGILGAGISLLVSEVAISVGYLIFAKEWLRNNSLFWPRKAFGLAVSSVFIASTSLGSLIWFPWLKWLILPVSMLLIAWNVLRYWRILPAFATEHARRFVGKIPGLKLFIS